MKIFIYKLLIACLAIFILFHITFGYLLRSYENKILNNFSKDKIHFLKDKIRNEIKESLKKDKILSDEDAAILKEFLIKIQNELR